MSNSENPPALVRVPLLPLRDLVVFPGTVVPLFVGRPSSVASVEEATARPAKLIMLATQRDSEVENPGAGDLYSIAVLAQIMQSMKLPDGSLKTVAQGIARYRCHKIVIGDRFISVTARLFAEMDIKGPESVALMRSVTDMFEEYVKLNRRIPHEVILSISGLEDPGKLADHVAAYSGIKVEDKQRYVLQERDPRKRLEFLLSSLSSEIEILKIEKRIRKEVRTQMEKSQKEYYISEQIKALQRELGREADEDTPEVAEYRKKLTAAGLSQEAKEKADKELVRLANMPPLSPEGTVVRNYLDWLIDLPWTCATEDCLDIDLADKILDEDHYGLEKPKERILEFLAVRSLVGKKNVKGPILCFVGPPGVGKTSLGRSIARSLGRRFVRMSLGGVRDEAEIRGHRRTYVGSLPGRILQMMKKAGSLNPVFLLDEVDKMSMDFRGDPSAALLEVLDPELNHSFVDHFLEIEYDLSNVFFITTANTIDPIPAALRDRMEIIEIPSYTSHEKFHIAKGFLVPKQIGQNGLTGKGVSFNSSGIESLIHEYTREAGVRNLEREIGSVLRKVAKEVAAGRARKRIQITSNKVHDYLGAIRFIPHKKEKRSSVGVATGLAWTLAGGETLTTEVSILPGKGELTLTGKLGDVMKESGRAALSYVRSRAGKLGLHKNFYKRCDVHIHVPEGAIPKDGPSAGITMAVAVVSALTGKAVRHDVAMTGEITLRGRVIPVGGVKEKLLAAHRAGIKTLVLPKANRKDIEDVPAEVIEEINLEFVENMDQVLEIVLVPGTERKKTERKD